VFAEKRRVCRTQHFVIISEIGRNTATNNKEHLSANQSTKQRWNGIINAEGLQESGIIAPSLL
jgi:hypothetical protein